MKRVLVAGLGNAMRGDDAAGLLAVRALRAIDCGALDVEEHDGDVAALAESMARHERVIVIDAVRADSAPGTVLKLTPDAAASLRPASSNGLGLREAIAMARVLGGRPRVEVYGIASESSAVGAAPSPAVMRAAADVALRIEERFRCA